MPAATKKRPPMEAEPGEGKAHEMGESPEEEVREGSETEEAQSSKPTNRKRTKAPMDSDCGCGAPKGKKCSCDSGCGDYGKKMDSALTAQEYIAACDLGVQRHSRSYIRARLDTASRLLAQHRAASTEAEGKFAKQEIRKSTRFLIQRAKESSPKSAARKRQANRKDIYADGFAFDPAALDI